jgi:uncharacterized protein YtpQ (UPF0354 family)
LGIREMHDDDAVAFCRRAIAYLKANLSEEDGDVFLEGDDEPVVMNLNNGLLVTYLVDQGDHFDYIQQRHLKSAALDEVQLHQIAIGNLATMLSEHGANLRKSDVAFGVLFDGHFEASLILLDSLWDGELAHLAPNGFIAALPTRDILAFCDAASEAGIAQLQRIIERVEGGDHPLKPILYRRDSRTHTWRPHAT